MRVRPVALILALFGQALIVLFFILFLPTVLLGISPAVLYLDLIVTSLIYWLFAWNIGMAPISLSDPSGKQAAGLGIRWNAVVIYAVAAIAVMFATFMLPFVWQLMIQAVILFLFLIALFASSQATRKAGQVHSAQMFAMSGKLDLKYTLTELADTADLTPGVPADVKRRLRAMAADCRYITPSSTAEAVNYEQRIVDDSSRLRAMLPEWESYGTQGDQLLSQVEICLKRRRQALA